MKISIRVILMVLLTLFASPLASVGAQDGAPQFSMLMYQRANSGSLIDSGDGTYALTLTDVSDTLFLQSAPINFNRLPTPLIVNGWTHVENAQPMEARLDTGPYSLSLQLSGPSYDEATASVSYVAQVTAVTSSDLDVDPDKIEIPETFDLADLVIQVDIDLYMGIEQNLFSGTRSDSCSYDPVTIALQNQQQVCGTYGYSSPECVAAQAKYWEEHDKWADCVGTGGSCCKF